MTAGYSSIIFCNRPPWVEPGLEATTYLWNASNFAQVIQATLAVREQKRGLNEIDALT